MRLTADGERVALEVMRHHRLLELYLAEHLGVPWDRVHEEAEALEHVISEDLEARIAAKLGNPTHDPHGDPIPDAALHIDEGDTRQPRRPRAPATAVASCACRTPTREMLRYLAERGVALGDALEVRRPPAVRRPGHRALRRRGTRLRRPARRGDARRARRVRLIGPALPARPARGPYMASRPAREPWFSAR